MELDLRAVEVGRLNPTCEGKQGENKMEDFLRHRFT